MIRSDRLFVIVHSHLVPHTYIIKKHPNGDMGERWRRRKENKDFEEWEVRE
jgi:hypothetical protein